jgi:threonylcarbamoyladenosine tRNA methylthiotransferase MtaB
MVPGKSITFAIHTIGCKTNQAESDDIARQLVLKGCSRAEIPDAVGAADTVDAVGSVCAAGSFGVAPDAAGAFDVAPDAACDACIAGTDSGIDYIIINTCTVTAAADRKARHLIRKLKRTSPKSKLIVTGCFVELNRELIKEISADYIFSNSKKNEIADLICGTEDVKEEQLEAVAETSTAGRRASAAETSTAGRRASAAETSTTGLTASATSTSWQTNKAGLAMAGITTASTFEPAATTAGITSESQHVHSRAFVKIQDGCRQGCSYCIVPLVRGPYLSTSPAKIIDDIRNLVYHGHDEIVLTGIHIGKFGVDLLSKKDEIKNLPELVLEILKNTGVKRLRLSSIEINEIDESLIGVIRNNKPRIAPHLHIPLQSGSDNVLKAMNRKYDSRFFISEVEHIKKEIPGITLTTDIIVGFPGETDEDFIKTVEMVKSMDFSRLHVFKYSKRPGTKAADMAGHLPEKTKTDRSRILRELGSGLRNSFVATNINKKLDVICEEYDIKNGFAGGISENYIKVYFSLHFEEYKLKKGKIVKVFAKSLYADGLYGDVI